MADWSSDMAKAPRGFYDVRAVPKGKGHVKTFVPEHIVAASACGVVTVSHYLPDEKRWEMFTADHPPIAWMPWTRGMKSPAHPTMATSWIDDLLSQRAAA
jgi:hypothetical protein